jgi:hypothetical protein
MKNKNRNNTFSIFRIFLKYFPASFVLTSREHARVFFCTQNNVVTNNNIVIN